MVGADSQEGIVQWILFIILGLLKGFCFKQRLHKYKKTGSPSQVDRGSVLKTPGEGWMSTSILLSLHADDGIDVSYLS